MSFSTVDTIVVRESFSPAEKPSQSGTMRPPETSCPPIRNRSTSGKQSAKPEPARSRARGDLAS
jgi:hypothetical protein